MPASDKGHPAPVQRGHAPIPVKPPKAPGGASGWELRDYQRYAVDWLKKEGWNCLLADAQGVGKTGPCLVSIAENVSTHCPALVSAPASVVLNWRREAKRWAKGLRIELVPPGGGPIPPGAHIVICSVALLWGRLDDLKGYGFRSFWADEAHDFKTPTSQRSMAAFALSQKVKYKCLLSGTPMVNNEEELDVLHRLLGRTDPPMLRRLLEDVAKDVPPKRRVYVPIELDRTTRAEYETVAADFAQYLREVLGAKLEDIIPDPESGVAKALDAEALVKIGYLRRVLARGKVDAAVRWTIQANRAAEPCILFAEHAEVIDLLKAKLKRARITFAVLDGKTLKKDRQKAIDDFQTGQVPVLIGSKAAMTGVTLTRARHTLFVERFWTSVIEEQGEDRSHRLGQIHETTMWYLHAFDTFDDRIRQIVDVKRARIKGVMSSSVIQEVALDQVATVMRRGEPTEEQLAWADSGDLPRLPKPGNVLCILFDPTRWQDKDAMRWCRMQGYRPEGVTRDAKGRIRVQINGFNRFAQGSFRIFRAAVDIALVTGDNAKKRRRKRKGQSAAFGPGFALGRAT